MKVKRRPHLQENLLLSGLPPEERQRLDPFLSRVRLEAGQPITEPDRAIPNLCHLNRSGDE